MEHNFTQRYYNLQKKLSLKTVSFEYKNFFFWISKVSHQLNTEKVVLLDFINKQANTIKLFSFFTRIGLSGFLLYRIFYYNYYNKWLLINYKFSAVQYKRFVHQILDTYFSLFYETEITNKNKLILFPSNFLLNFTNVVTSEKRLTHDHPNMCKTWFEKTKNYDLSKLSRKSLNNSFNSSIRELLSFGNLNYSGNQMKLNFLRVQRRYNKRRYSKVRAYSRPSFFGGTALSSLFLASFWGGTMKGTDWQSTFMVNIDINLIIFAVVLYLFNKLLRFSYWSNFIAVWNRSKFAYNLNKMLDLQLFKRLRW